MTAAALVRTRCVSPVATGSPPTVRTALRDIHHVWMRDTLRWLAPTLSPSADFWDGWSAVRYINRSLRSEVSLAANAREGHPSTPPTCRWLPAAKRTTGNAGAGCNAAPMTFTHGGEQFITVACGGNFQLSYPLGDAVMVFGFPKPWTP